MMMDKKMDMPESCKSLQHWTLEIDSDGLAWLFINVDGKSVNILTNAVLAELETILNTLEATKGLAGVGMLSGKPGGFV